MALPFAEAGLFGYAARCQNLPETLRLLLDVADADAKSAVAAYGMALTAKLGKRGPYINDTIELLNELGHAKAALDSTARHSQCVFGVTAGILLAAQEYAADHVIPCTEWPSVDDVAGVVLEKAIGFSNVGTWRLFERRADGAIVGTRIVRANG